MFSVLLGEVGILCGDSPIYSKAFIQDTNPTIYFWMVELITLILENSRFAQDCKTMSKATRHKELAMIVFSQFYCHMLSVCRASLTNVQMDKQIPQILAPY